MKKAITYASVALLIVLPLSQVFRGIDVTDVGFVLTNQRFIFSAPQSVSYWFHLWLTNIVGGLVDVAFGRFGILPHKIAAALILWITAYATVGILYDKLIPKRKALIAFAAAVGFQVAGKMIIVHYNNLSALLYVLGIATLAQAARKDRLPLYFLSGAILGLNCFARIPNLVGLGLIVVPPAIALLFDKTARRKRVLLYGPASFFCGALVAAALALISMKVLGHLELYLDSLVSLTRPGAVDAGNYETGMVLMRPLRDTLLALAWAVPLIVLSFAIAVPLGRARSGVRRYALAVVLVGVAGALMAATRLEVFGMRTMVSAIIGACYWLIASLILDPKASPSLKNAGAAAAAISLALNIGSDTGIMVSMYAIPVMFPAAYVAAKGLSGRITAFFESKGWTSWAGVPAHVPTALGAFVFSVSLLAGSVLVYRDAYLPTRFVEHPQLAGVLTSRARSQALTEGIRAVENVVPPGGTLFAFDSVPLIHFATRTVPFLSNPWPVLYSGSFMEKLLLEREASGALPPVLLALRNPRSETWPVNNKKTNVSDAVQAFLSRNGYRETWSNSAFSLLLPAGAK